MQDSPFRLIDDRFENHRFITLCYGLTVVLEKFVLPALSVLSSDFWFASQKSPLDLSSDRDSLN